MTQPTEVELNTYLNKLLLQGHIIVNPSYQTFSKASLDRFSELLVGLSLKLFVNGATRDNRQQAKKVC